MHLLGERLCEDFHAFAQPDSSDYSVDGTTLYSVPLRFLMIVTVVSVGLGASCICGEAALRSGSPKSASVTRPFATTLASPAFRRINDRLPTLLASKIFCA